MNISDHDIMAFVDGELDAIDAARIENAIASDVLIAARVERERRLRASLRGAYAPVTEEPVPDRLRALVESHTPASGNVVALRRRPIATAWRYVGVALAASVAAVAVSSFMRPDASIHIDGGELVAGGALAKALEQSLASEVAGGSGPRIGLTFRATDGRVCRSVSDPSLRVAALACRDGTRWVLPVTARVDAAGSELRQASSALPAAIQSAIDERIEGDSFDAAQERQSRERGWR